MKSYHTVPYIDSMSTGKTIAVTVPQQCHDGHSTAPILVTWEANDWFRGNDTSLTSVLKSVTAWHFLSLQELQESRIGVALDFTENAARQTSEENMARRYQEGATSHCLQDRGNSGTSWISTPFLSSGDI